MGAGQSEQTIRQNLKDAKTVLVVGGSYIGTGIAKLLENDLNVIVLERKNYHLHNIGALRACVDPLWSKNIVVPYDKALSRGQIVQAEVREITPTDIHLNHHDQPLKFDYCVIATGTSYAFPARVPTWQAEEVMPMYMDMAKALSVAKSVIVVGGGPVGVELCGEIRDAHPASRLKLTLIQSQGHLIPSPPGYEITNKFRVKLLEKVKSRDIDVRLGERVELDDELKQAFGKLYYAQGNRTVKTNKGTYECDLIFWAFGARTNSQSYEKHFAAAMAPSGRLRVQDTQQVEGHDNIFAVGDCSVGGTRGEMQMFFVAEQTLPTVADNIRMLAAGKTVLKKFKGPFPAGAMIVPVGKDGGVSNMPMPVGVRGDFMTRKMKSKDLMTTAAWKLMGYADKGVSSANLETLPVDEDRLASTLGIDQTSAAALAHGLGVEEGFLAAPETKSAAGGNKLLVIVSSPMEEESVTNAVSNAFLEGYKSAFPADQVETLDISAGQLQPFTASRVLAKFKNQSGGDVETQQEWAETKLMIENFKGADKIVFLLPCWNFHVPSDVILYLDHLVQAHKTFDPKTMTGLVTGKPALLICASSGLEIGSSTDYGTAYMKQVLAFMGFADIRVLAASGPRGNDGQRPWLDAVKKQAKEIAANFTFDAAASLPPAKEMFGGVPQVPDPTALPSGARILHVSCSPLGEHSATLAAAAAFLSEAKAKTGSTVEHVDLSLLAEEHRLQPFGASGVKAMATLLDSPQATMPRDIAQEWQHTAAFIEQYKAADVIVLSIPMWNLSIPFSLKLWIDHVAQPHHTYDPATNRGLSQKRGFVIAASGWGLLGGAMDHVTGYMQQCCSHIGIDPVFFVNINGTVGDDRASKIEGAVDTLKRQACLN